MCGIRGHGTSEWVWRLAKVHLGHLGHLGIRREFDISTNEVRGREGKIRCEILYGIARRAREVEAGESEGEEVRIRGKGDMSRINN